MRQTFLSLAASDGFPLAAALFEPPQPPIAAVLISGATGVPRHRYNAYARFLAQRGFAVLTYDYRGIGASRWPGCAERDLRMRDWGARDLACGIDALQQRFPQLPLLAVGHSVGGQLLGLADNNHKVRAQLAIAAQDGYWGHWPRRLQPILAFFWYAWLPLLTRLAGRLPAAALGGSELPRGIALEWARWCRNPQFICDDEGAALRAGFSAFRGAMLFYAIADDEFHAPLRAVERLAARYDNARSDIRLCDPSRYGLQRLGHFGFFRPDAPVRLWHETVEWLRAQAQAAVPAPLRRAA